MAGSVFSKIAERVYAKDLRLDIRNAIDTNTVVIPDVKAGEMIEARQVLEGLNIQTQAEFKAKKNKEVWGLSLIHILNNRQSYSSDIVHPILPCVAIRQKQTTSA